jgi:hypothetical protein
MAGHLRAAMGSAQLWVAYNGILLDCRRTRGITEVVVFSVLSSIALFALGSAYGQVPGLIMAMASLSLGGIVQTIWLWRSTRSKASAT